MPEKYLFEYAVIRVVPRVEREEFLNVGLIMYSRDLKFLQARFQLDQNKLLTFAAQADQEEIEEHLKAICLISKGEEGSGPIGKLDLSERFRWLTATRSTIVQTSKVHPGLCEDAAATLTKLHQQLVLPPQQDQ